MISSEPRSLVSGRRIADDQDVVFTVLDKDDHWMECQDDHALIIIRAGVSG